MLLSIREYNVSQVCYTEMKQWSTFSYAECTCMYVQYCIVLVKLVQSLLYSSVSNYLERVEGVVLLFMAPYVVLLTLVIIFSLKKTLIRKKMVSAFVTFLGRFPNLESLEWVISYHCVSIFVSYQALIVPRFDGRPYIGLSNYIWLFYLVGLTLSLTRATLQVQNLFNLFYVATQIYK